LWVFLVKNKNQKQVYSRLGDSNLSACSIETPLAEAFTELMHFKLRTELWGYSTEAFNNQQLIQEKFDGIRPAPG
jgi:cobalamin-dependent methionine synthase I